MKQIFLSMLLLGALAGCRQDVIKEEPKTDKIYFSGLTGVDETGAWTGPYDSTDWRLDDVWVAQESGLFAPSTLPLCGSLPPDSLGVFISPNPCKEVSMLGFQTPSGTTWRFRFVDENFVLIKVYDWEMAIPWYNSLAINTTGFPKDTIRVYYMVERAGCVWRGHGDILIED